MSIFCQIVSQYRPLFGIRKQFANCSTQTLWLLGLVFTKFNYRMALR